MNLIDLVDIKTLLITPSIPVLSTMFHISPSSTSVNFIYELITSVSVLHIIHFIYFFTVPLFTFFTLYNFSLKCIRIDFIQWDAILNTNKIMVYDILYL